MSPISGLDEPCATCDRPAGDHTLREWSTCMGTVTTDLPFEPIPDDLATAAGDAIRSQFDLDDDIVVADHVIVKAATLTGTAGGGVGILIPALIHEFQIGLPGKPPAEVARVVFVGDEQSMRGYGRLVRDSANGAVNAAERG